MLVLSKKKKITKKNNIAHTEKRKETNRNKGKGEGRGKRTDPLPGAPPCPIILNAPPIPAEAEERERETSKFCAVPNTIWEEYKFKDVVLDVVEAGGAFEEMSSIATEPY